MGAGSVLLAVLVHLHGVSRIEKIAEKNPDMALLEGAQLLALREKQFLWEAKNQTAQTAIEAQQSDPSLPVIEAAKDADTLEIADADRKEKQWKEKQ